jgi:deoxyribodipyrimidine photolyase-related protein
VAHFREELARRSVRSRTVSGWVLVAPDQLTLDIGPLARDRNAGVLLVESEEWLSRRPYHRQRLAWILLAMRAFALEAAADGRCVRYESTDGPIVEAVERFTRGSRRVQLMQPAERELRAELAPLVERGLVEIVPHEGWLTTGEDFRASFPKAKPPYRMDTFYRTVRKRTGILVEKGKPVGGAWSFDAENRRPWPGTPAAPEPPRFPPSPLRTELAKEFDERFASHPGHLDLATIPETRDEVDALWSWARRECLEHFGPFEDAMSVRSRGLFHTRISPAMNLLRILPSRVVADTLAMRLPLASQEGFIRQILGWREFVRHVHEATDGFRTGLAVEAETVRKPGRAGLPAKVKTPAPPPGVDGGGAPDALAADLPLPAAFWGEAWPDGARPSGLNCLDRVVADVWAEGWSHHITRLMVLSNLATLVGVRPRELTDWFWIAYADAWEWVVEPNVLGMGTFAAGETMTTKPYISGAGYLAKMSDYCAGCAFDPAKDCPLTPLYWAFLARHEKLLARNPRMGVVLAAMRKRGPERQAKDRAAFVHVREVLVRGERLGPTRADTLWAR